MKGKAGWGSEDVVVWILVGDEWLLGGVLLGGVLLLGGGLCDSVWVGWVEFLRERQFVSVLLVAVMLESGIFCWEVLFMWVM